MVFSPGNVSVVIERNQEKAGGNMEECDYLDRSNRFKEIGIETQKNEHGKVGVGVGCSPKTTGFVFYTEG